MNEKRILMHVCCGPCSEWPVKELRERGFAPYAYFYNPNIQPQGEFDLRLATMKKAAEIYGLELFSEGKSQTEHWIQMQKLGKKAHCRICYSMRLWKAACFAAENGFKFMTTTLLVSPYQDYERICQIGCAAASRKGIHFLPFEFFKHYREGQNMAKADGLYRQKYCGCIYSLGETRDKYKKELMSKYGLQASDIPGRALLPKQFCSDRI